MRNTTPDQKLLTKRAKAYACNLNDICIGAGAYPKEFQSPTLKALLPRGRTRQ
jgi:hypothetical protein